MDSVLWVPYFVWCSYRELQLQRSHRLFESRRSPFCHSPRMRAGKFGLAVFKISFGSPGHLKCLLVGMVKVSPGYALTMLIYSLLVKRIQTELIETFLLMRWKLTVPSMLRELAHFRAANPILLSPPTQYSLGRRLQPVDYEALLLLALDTGSDKVYSIILC